MSPDQEIAGNSLSEIVESQIACTSRLVDVLEAEREALMANDVDALEQACTAKSIAAQHLQQLGERWAIKIGRLTARGEIEAFLGRQTGGQRLLARWAELGRLAKFCNDANRANGALLELREKEVRGALAAMQPEAPSVYGRRGSSRPEMPSQIISRA